LRQAPSKRFYSVTEDIIERTVKPLRPLAVEMLRLAHLEPGITRADAARRLRVGSGTASELAASLVRAGLIAEQAQHAVAGRGRPTRELVAAPHGPIVFAAAIRHAGWQLDAIALGGGRVASLTGRHQGSDGPETLAGLAAAVMDMRHDFPGRVQGLGVSAAGLVYDGDRLDATSLGWRGVDLRRIWPDAPLFTAANDATLAAVAEGARGSAGTSALTVQLHIDAGLGGAILQHGNVLEGAHGFAGEFGHLPMGDPGVECPCGASGCWGASVDGTHLARLLGDPPPSDPVGYSHRILTRAGAGDGSARAGVAGVAQILGRGTAGLANALDPDLIVVGGLAPEILSVAPDSFQRAYIGGLMSSRRSNPAPVRQARLGEQGPITGAAESVWPLVWQTLAGGDLNAGRVPLTSAAALRAPASPPAG
jgi:predicted NBD/HSP70 family sugar kinase